MTNLENTSNFIFYSNTDGNLNIQVTITNDSVWLSQQEISNLFKVDRSVITKHIKNIYEVSELDRVTTSAKIAQVQNEGGRDVKRNIELYNLDMIISVGYRVNSIEATQFRIWATKTLNEYLTKGFVIDDDRMKHGGSIFNKDYFDELVERIREIRASERRFYQKITDIFAQCSIDYTPNSMKARQFFATVQNKLEFAITRMTAPEIIMKRVDSKKPDMGLTSWKNSKKGGKIVKSDVSVAKNYLNEPEIKELNSVVTMYLDYAELQATKNAPMKMDDWAEKLDAFLIFNEYDILNNAGTVKKSVAESIAEKEYAKYRVIQDIEYESDFDKLVVKKYLPNKGK